MVKVKLINRLHENKEHLSEATRRVKIRNHKLGDIFLIRESTQITRICNETL